jgi:hypothetical protein
MVTRIVHVQCASFSFRILIATCLQSLMFWTDAAKIVVQGQIKLIGCMTGSGRALFLTQLIIHIWISICSCALRAQETNEESCFLINNPCNPLRPEIPNHSRERREASCTNQWTNQPWGFVRRARGAASLRVRRAATRTSVCCCYVGAEVALGRSPACWACSSVFTLEWHYSD